MATFTRIEEGESPSITIHPNHKIAEIDNNIYGGFTE
jgi:alpha-N-arabinofuranosidase